MQIAGVVRNYHGLRPLRIASLAIAAGERVALSGLDLAASELLVNLITGATLPDEGDVRVFGRSTADITSADEWLASLERFGIVSPRAVLLEGATIQQNLAMPFTLEIDPVPPHTAERIAALAEECGIGAGSPHGPASVLGARTGDAPPEVRARLHFARAIALDPALILLEHPAGDLDEQARSALGSDMVRVLEGRRLAALVISGDERFALRVAHRALRLQPASGELQPVRRGWFR